MEQIISLYSVYHSFPLWFAVLFSSSLLAVLHFLLEKEPPETEQILLVLVSFVMGVVWTSTVAGELLNCLEALGIVLEVLDLASREYKLCRRESINAFCLNPAVEEVAVCISLGDSLLE
ncbi:hypothetical protein NC651_012503 [Populus alba x Populus x berolinensis]|nr:hypothetical protein NC651_012503 [Populus alba x Populus x berolinensis]